MDDTITKKQSLKSRELVAKLQTCFADNGLKEGDWNDGPDNVDGTLEILNQFLGEQEIVGKLILVWDFYDGNFGGNNSLFLRSPGGMAREVSIPLFEEGIEEFVSDLLGNDEPHKLELEVETDYQGAYL